MASEVRVKLVQDTETKRVEVIVSIRSNKRAGLVGSIRIDADHPRLKHEVRQAAIKLALHQVANYRDAHDPEECGTVAMEALREIEVAAGRVTRKVMSEFSDRKNQG